MPLPLSSQAEHGEGTAAEYHAEEQGTQEKHHLPIDQVTTCSSACGLGFGV